MIDRRTLSSQVLHYTINPLIVTCIVVTFLQNNPIRGENTYITNCQTGCTYNSDSKTDSSGNKLCVVDVAEFNEIKYNVRPTSSYNYFRLRQPPSSFWCWFTSSDVVPYSFKLSDLENIWFAPGIKFLSVSGPE